MTATRDTGTRRGRAWRSSPRAPWRRYFDLLAGKEAQAQVDGGTVRLHGDLRPRGIGAFLSSGKGDLGAESPSRREILHPVEPTREVRKEDLPAGMAAIPGAALDLAVRFGDRECGRFQTPLQRRVVLTPYALDLTRWKG